MCAPESKISVYYDFALKIANFELNCPVVRSFRDVQLRIISRYTVYNFAKHHINDRM